MKKNLIMVCLLCSLGICSCAKNETLTSCTVESLGPVRSEFQLTGVTLTMFGVAYEKRPTLKSLMTHEWVVVDRNLNVDLQPGEEVPYVIEKDGVKLDIVIYNPTEEIIKTRDSSLRFIMLTADCEFALSNGARYGCSILDMDELLAGVPEYKIDTNRSRYEAGDIVYYFTDNILTEVSITF